MAGNGHENGNGNGSSARLPPESSPEGMAIQGQLTPLDASVKLRSDRKYQVPMAVRLGPDGRFLPAKPSDKIKRVGMTFGD